MIQLLNSGYKKGAKKGKKEPNGKGWGSEKLDPYSPKMIAGIRNINETLISRSITMFMLLSNNDEVKNREINESDHMITEIRDALYYSVMELFRDIRKTYFELTDSIITGRNWEIWRPVLSVALVVSSLSDSDIYQTVREFALQQIKLQLATNIDNQNTLVMLDAIKEMMQGEEKICQFYPLSTVRQYLFDHYEEYFAWMEKNDVSTSSKFIGDELRKVGLVTGPAMPVKIDGKTRRGYIIDRNKISAILNAYGYSNGNDA